MPVAVMLTDCLIFLPL